MTDEQIIKALECCIKETSDCDNCPLYIPADADCINISKSGALDLINRLQAENERLKNALTDHEYTNCVAVKNGLIYTHTLEDYENLIADISAEAIKEFVERLNDKAFHDMNDGEAIVCCCDIDDLVKEMVGEG